MRARQLVARRGEDGTLRVAVEPLVSWQIVGARRPKPPEAVAAASEADELRLMLAAEGLGSHPVLSLSTDEDGNRTPHLTWPDASGADAELARLVALASTSIFDEVPELDGAEPDAAHELAVAEQFAADRRMAADARPSRPVRSPRSRRRPGRGRPELLEVVCVEGSSGRLIEVGPLEEPQAAPSRSPVGRRSRSLVAAGGRIRARARLRWSS